VNPDGWKAKTRTNANGVDLNRNFPTGDWESQAIGYWKKKTKSDPRRYPGPDAASEVETKCLMKHFEEFKPDFLISVHTPLGVLDFDGPKIKSPPPFKPLPWRSLGNFPGSLGRYMWADQHVPVLTIELKGNEDVRKLEAFDRLQDISGTVAIQAAVGTQSASKTD
jgi:protein MpaA